MNLSNKQEKIIIDIEPLSFKVFGEKPMMRFIKRKLKEGKRDLVLVGDLL